MVNVEPHSQQEALVLWSARRDNACVAKHTKSPRPDIVHERPKEDWHKLLDDLTVVRAADDVTIELLDDEFGDERPWPRPLPQPLEARIVDIDHTNRNRHVFARFELLQEIEKPPLQLAENTRIGDPQA